MSYGEPIEPPTKFVGQMRDALDVACDEFGLRRGVLLGKTKHFKYRTELQDGTQVTVTIPGTPRAGEHQLKHAKSSLRAAILGILESKGKL